MNSRQDFSYIYPYAFKVADPIMNAKLNRQPDLKNRGYYNDPISVSNGISPISNELHQQRKRGRYDNVVGSSSLISNSVWSQPNQPNQVHPSNLSTLRLPSSFTYSPEMAKLIGCCLDGYTHDGPVMSLDYDGACQFTRACYYTKEDVDKKWCEIIQGNLNTEIHSKFILLPSQWDHLLVRLCLRAARERGHFWISLCGCDNDVNKGVQLPITIHLQVEIDSLYQHKIVPAEHQFQVNRLGLLDPDLDKFFISFGWTLKNCLPNMRLKFV